MKQISISAVRLASVGLACSMAGSMALAAGTLTVTGALTNNQCTFTTMNVTPTGDVTVACGVQTGITPLSCTVTAPVGNVSLTNAGGQVTFNSTVTDPDLGGGALSFNWAVAPSTGVTPTPPLTTQNASFTFPPNTGTSAINYTVTFTAQNSLSPTPATCSQTQTRTVSVAGSTPPPTGCPTFNGTITPWAGFNNPGNPIDTPSLATGQVAVYSYTRNATVFPNGAVLNVLANTNIGGNNFKDVAVSGCPGVFDVPNLCKVQVGSSVKTIRIDQPGFCAPQPVNANGTYYISVRPTAAGPASAKLNTSKP